MAEEIMDFSKVKFDIGDDSNSNPQDGGDAEPIAPPSDPPAAPPATEGVPIDPAPNDFDTVFATKFGGKKVEDIAADLARVAETEKLLQDPFLKDFVDRYHKGEDLTPYIHAKSMDYDKVGSEELAMMKLGRKYPNAPKEILAKLYDDEYVKQYGLNDTENEVGKYRFDTEMDQFRAELKEEQKKFLIPDQDNRQSPTKEAEEKLKQETEAFYKMVDSDPSVQALITDKKIALKQGDESVFVGVTDPAKLVEATKSDKAFWELFRTESGGADIGKFLRVAAFAADEEAFKAALIGYGKKQATETVITNLQNPASNPASTPRPVAGSLAEAVLNKLGGN